MKYPCSICGEFLEEYEGTADCMFCGEQEASEYICPEGHFQCEECRLSDPNEIIERTCTSYDGTDPFELASLIMKHTSFNPHGVEHHLLVAPVILTICRNLGLEISNKKIKTAMKRVEDIPYGACGSRGGCGASESAGTAVSLITGASFNSDAERSLTLKATANSLLKIAEIGGPRCCKQSVYGSVEETFSLLIDEYVLPSLGRYRCVFSDEIEDCKGERCPYHE